MITILHGDDINASRQRFLEERQKTKGAVVFDGRTITLGEILQTFEGVLFDQKKIFIENLFSEKKGKDVEQIVSYLSQNHTSHEVFIWEGKEVAQKFISSIPDALALAFKLPQKLFVFLDQIRPNNGKDLVILFHELTSRMEPELVFYMLVRQVRLLLALSDNLSSAQIDEVKRLASWQKQKLERQARLFPQSILKKLHAKLYQIDLSQKTGKTSFSLTQNIDFFLLDL